MSELYVVVAQCKYEGVVHIHPFYYRSREAADRIADRANARDLEDMIRSQEDHVRRLRDDPEYYEHARPELRLQRIEAAEAELGDMRERGLGTLNPILKVLVLCEGAE